MGFDASARVNDGGERRGSRGGRAHPGHDGDEEEEEGFPMACHVGFWELDADGEDSDGEDDAGELEGDRVGDLFAAVAPASRVEYARTVWS